MRKVSHFVCRFAIPRAGYSRGNGDRSLSWNQPGFSRGRYTVCDNADGSDRTDWKERSCPEPIQLCVEKALVVEQAHHRSPHYIVFVCHRSRSNRVCKSSPDKSEKENLKRHLRAFVRIGKLYKAKAQYGQVHT